MLHIRNVAIPYFVILNVDIPVYWCLQCHNVGMPHVGISYFVMSECSTAAIQLSSPPPWNVQFVLFSSAAVTAMPEFWHVAVSQFEVS